MTWQPITPMRWIMRRKDLKGTSDSDVNPLYFYDHVLQQCWAEYIVNEFNQVVQSDKYHWEDVPQMDEADPGLNGWNKDE